MIRLALLAVAAFAAACSSAPDNAFTQGETTSEPVAGSAAAGSAGAPPVVVVIVVSAGSTSVAGSPGAGAPSVDVGSGGASAGAAQGGAPSGGQPATAGASAGGAAAGGASAGAAQGGGAGAPPIAQACSTPGAMRVCEASTPDANSFGSSQTCLAGSWTTCAPVTCNQKSWSGDLDFCGVPGPVTEFQCSGPIAKPKGWSCSPPTGKLAQKSDGSPVDYNGTRWCCQ